MTTLFSQDFPRTLDALVDTLSHKTALSAEAWVFDDEPSRREAEARLAQTGVTARFRSAYKPLVHAFLEEIDLNGAKALEIAYPVHAGAEPRRFLLEAYPLAGLVGIPVDFVARDDGGLFYDVTITQGAGGSKTIRVDAPNRIHTDHTGEEILSPTGWLRLSQGGIVMADERFETDYEALFSSAISTIRQHEWGPTEPYFDELRITATLPATDRALDLGEEAISLCEALHEDLYFSGLEIFQKKSGRASGDRGLQPGRIVPVITYAPGQARLEITLNEHDAALPEAPSQPLATAAAPLSFADVALALEAVGGEAFSSPSCCGRAVSGRYRSGSDVPVMISGGQHANEPTGVVGALRAAQRLAENPNANFGIVPLENPDGYALARQLYAIEPRHMHHAARYTALGDDLEFRQTTPLFERQVREDIVNRSGAQLHVNLHGYPAHEWTRPLTGYVPRNFALWTVPKGFFLILRHQPGFADKAETLALAVAEHLAQVPGLVDFNARQIELYRRHAGELDFEVVSGFPIKITEMTDHKVPVTLITEYPDETIYGDAFRLGHEAQMQTVIGAYAAWQEISAR